MTTERGARILDDVLRVRRQACGESVRRQIEAALVDEIERGKFRSLGPFPSERGLALRFGVSRQTIRGVIMRLQQRGLVYTRQGRGTFLAPASACAKDVRRIGVIVSGGCYSEIFGSICNGLAEAAERSKMELEICDVAGLDGERLVLDVEEMARKLVEKGVSGVVFQPIQFAETAEEVNRRIVDLFKSSGISVVLIDCDIVSFPYRSEFDVIGINNFKAGVQVGWHLLDAGARSVRFVSGLGRADSVRFRALGAKSVLEERFAGDDFVADANDVRQLERLLRPHPEADAFVCQNDITAAAVIGALDKLGKKVPRDVLVVGFDDVAFAAWVSPSLTTVRQPCKQIAEAAFKRLVARLDDPGMPPAELFLDSPLVRRESTRRRIESRAGLELVRTSAKTGMYQ